MKRFPATAVCWVVLALVGVATLKSGPLDKVPSTAIVKSVKGTGTYTKDGASNPLKAHEELDAGVTITTGPHSTVDLRVHGTLSAVQVQADTTLAIPQMNRIGSAESDDTETTLDLKIGSIIGNVKKLSANSGFQIKTPHGIGGIREPGTDFAINVAQNPGGSYSVTFTCVKGQLIVSALVSGAIQNKTLHDGETWDSDLGDVHATHGK